MRCPMNCVQLNYYSLAGHPEQAFISLDVCMSYLVLGAGVTDHCVNTACAFSQFFHDRFLGRSGTQLLVRARLCLCMSQFVLTSLVGGASLLWPARRSWEAHVLVTCEGAEAIGHSCGHSHLVLLFVSFSNTALEGYSILGLSCLRRMCRWRDSVSACASVLPELDCPDFSLVAPSRLASAKTDLVRLRKGSTQSIWRMFGA